MKAPREPLLEVCVDSLRGAIEASERGAQRLELCARLDVGGLTPSPQFVADSLARTGLPCHVMLRSRGGDFVFAADEWAAMERELEWIRTCGARGVVLGGLDAAGAVDKSNVRRLVAAARPLAVTFHRAFDAARDLERSLDALIELGIERVLTSGGAPNAWAGRAKLRELVQRAADRIVVMPGGGVRIDNAQRLLLETGAVELHSSTPFHLRRSA